MKRRDAIKAGLTFVGTGTVAKIGNTAVPQSGLIFPETFEPSIVESPSPPVTPFVVPLYRIPIANPVTKAELEAQGGAIDPQAHQRYNEFLPKKFYVQVISEFKWQYHTDPPYNAGSWGWGFNGATPGETFHSRYGEPVLVRRINNLPPVGSGNVTFALPSVTIHRHNGHQPSESDGIPQDFFDPGQFWDYHYPLYPAGGDPLERMSTLWYHDHRLDFTATNVYAGLSGFHLNFDDEFDTNNERDPRPGASRLPSGNYDVPLILHDVQFDQNGQPVFDFNNPAAINGIPKGFNLDSRNVQNPAAVDTNSFETWLGHETWETGADQHHTTFGMVGDRYTVNRIIQPYFKVERRKYRFRILNGGPSRLYNLSLKAESSTSSNPSSREQFIVISTDGNFLQEPLVKDNIEVWVAQRHDVIIDFSKFKAGEFVYLVNRLGMRDDGAGPNGRDIEPGDKVMRFDVIEATGPDPSRVPHKLRKFPKIDLNLVRRERTFVFDYDNGLFTINGRLMDPNRVDVKIEQGSAEIWTLINEGNSWVHPIHTHFEEFRILEVNGKPIAEDDILNSRKDVVSLGPGMKMKFYSRWRDFLGKHVMHCHNVVHEDHAMMIRWDIVPPGQGD